ncbi:pentapeptide repeat-containing protein [Serratia fonticola]|uniref:pentapeptide repeat-containing protein n=1 Tax=Serratia fonticola TaxID=47917 RepID=UPI0014154756|nr:pentapeptide repeat-containing protein [Serratia fonticola]QIP94501.1 secreted effector protein [Serratia fonticola]
MNNLSLYLKARFCNSATAAVQLAENKPSSKNINFARKILNVKQAAADVLFQQSASCRGFHQAKTEKYSSLENVIARISSNKESYNTSSLNINKSTPENLSQQGKKDFSNEDLRNYNLSGKDLRGCVFSKSNYNNYIIGNTCNTNFSGSNLNGVDLSSAFFHYVDFSKSSLVETKIITNLANYSGAKLDGSVILFNLPACWDDSNLDILLNDSNNRKTLFNTISTIDDKYIEIKTNLMTQIVESIERDGIDINSAIFPRKSFLNNIGLRDFYMNNEKIKSFTEKLVKCELADANNKITLDKLSPEALSLCIKTIAQTKNHADLKEHLIDNNGSFIQLMVVCNNNDNLEVQNQARSLYNTYLNIDEVKSYTEKEEFGNGEKEPDWSEKSNLNYILISKSKAIIIDHENLSKMLHLDRTDTDVKWDNFYLYNNNECQAAGDINYKELFCNDFKVFEDGYMFDLNKSSFVNLLSTLELSDYTDRFNSVLSGELVSDELKLVGTEDQLKLNNIFEKVLTRPNDSAKETMLKAEHYDKILSVFNLDQKDEKIKSQTLLSLATVFSKYSSSSVFGTEDESPQVLRDYAYALMSKANELNPEVTGGNFNDWKDRLLGLNNAFTCTAVLSSIMIEHAKDNFNEVISQIIPPVWA